MGIDYLPSPGKVLLERTTQCAVVVLEQIDPDADRVRLSIYSRKGLSLDVRYTGTVKDIKNLCEAEHVAYKFLEQFKGKQ